MTPQRARDLLPIIQAFAEGKEIEVREADINTIWYDTIRPEWDDSLEYRIKPEPKIITGWVNVYPDGFSTRCYDTKDEAKQDAVSRCIDTIEIRYEVKEE